MPERDRKVEWAGVRGAVSFLTTLPVGQRSAVAPRDIGRGVIYFPLVGAAVGAAGALTAWGFARVLPVTVAALLAVGVGAVLTGALHLDGLADTADGYGARTRSRALEIMHEHAVGSYGMVALILDVGLRAAAVVALLSRPWGLHYLVAAGALSRSVAVGLGILVPGARAEGGFAALLDGVGRWRAGVAITLGVVIAALSTGWAALAAIGLLAVGAALWGWHCRRRLGGMTGDTLGAASEVSELVVLLTGVALR